MGRKENGVSKKAFIIFELFLKFPCHPKFPSNFAPYFWNCLNNLIKDKKEGKYVTIICSTGETTQTAHNFFTRFLLPSRFKLSAVLQRHHWFRYELHGRLWSSCLSISGCRRIPEWVIDFPILDDCVMNLKKASFQHSFFKKKMRTSPTPKLSSWPFPSTTMLETTPSLKWQCSGRQSFLKLSRNTRKILLPTSPLHTWQRYILIFNRSICFLKALCIFLPLFLSDLFNRGLWRMR